MHDNTLREALGRLQNEYSEMPGLKLTAPQARRLCNLPLDACQLALEVLAHAGFLRQLSDGSFLRPGPSGALPRRVIA